MTTIHVRGLKIASLIPAEAIPADLVPPEPQPAGRAIFEVALEGSGLVLRVECNGKAVRKALKAIAEHGPDGSEPAAPGDDQAAGQARRPAPARGCRPVGHAQGPQAGRALGGPLIPPADGRTRPIPRPQSARPTGHRAAVPRASCPRAGFLRPVFIAIMRMLRCDSLVVVVA